MKNKNLNLDTLLADTVTDCFSSCSEIDTDKAASSFEDKLKTLSDEEIGKVLLYAGFIPDLYIPDSSQETLYSKFCEVLISHWANRMGFTSTYIKQKGSYEDVNIKINDKVIVCDAKSFRLSRSQKAPNVKDFLKLEDIRKWLNRYETQKLGGLVIYPDTHEWTTASDAYQYCTTKNTPTVMLPYKYLTLLLKFKNKFNTNKLEQLWNYDNLFPSVLKKKDNNKVKYWNVINSELINILNIEKDDFFSYLSDMDLKISFFIKEVIKNLEEIKKNCIAGIKTSVDVLTKEEMKKQLLDLRIKEETSNIDIFVSRISKFRLSDR